MDKSNFIRLFQNAAPGSEDVTLAEEHYFEEMPDGRTKELIQNVSVPGLYPYLLDGKAKGAVIIIPGGNFKRLVINFEGSEIARWFQSIGYTAFVLTPRLPLRPTAEGVMLAPHRNLERITLADVQRAVRIVRQNADKWGYPADKIGVAGFSGGGYFASMAATCFDKAVYEKTDDTDDISARPDFCVLGYPVINLESQQIARENRIRIRGGETNEQLQEWLLKKVLLEEYSIDRLVTKNTPPVFVFETDDDTATAAENSISFYMAARQAGVPAELHIFKNGGHGFGLGDYLPLVREWKRLCENWLETV